MDDESIKCPGCGGEFGLKEKKCPHCGRWLGARGISFYFFFGVLAVVVAGLIAYFVHCGFVMLTRML